MLIKYAIWQKNAGKNKEKVIKYSPNYNLEVLLSSLTALCYKKNNEKSSQNKEKDSPVHVNPT